MNYENMSDFEINKAVAEAQGVRGFYPSIVSDNGGLLFSNGKEFNPCNNPSDAWPIIEQIWGTLMSVTSYDFGVGLGESKTTVWEARANMYKDGKLRAAMIVYLMMQENNQ